MVFKGKNNFYMKKSTKIQKNDPEIAKVGRKRVFSISLRTRVLRSQDNVDIQILIKFPNDINGKKISTGLKCPPKMLNSKTWEIRQNSVDSDILKTMRQNVSKAYLEGLAMGKRLKHQSLFDSAFGQSQNKQITVIQAIERCFTKVYLSNATDWKQTTVIKNQQRVAVLKEFFKDKFNNQEVYFDDLKPQIADDLMEWAKIKRGNNTYTAIRLVKFMKRIINFAIANDWVTINPFLSFKAKFDSIQIVALNEDEIKALRALDLTTEIMAQTRDLFVFCVFTGLAYAELKSLKFGNIKVLSSQKTIIINRQKLGSSRAVVPMLPEAERILHQLQPTIRDFETPCFKVPTNQSLNRILKELAAMAGINKVLKWHSARKSCGTLLLNRGVPIEIVQAIMGHKSVKITQMYYALMHDETVVKAIQRVDFNGI